MESTEETKSKDLQQVFEGMEERLNALEAEKYPTSSRKEFMAACMKNKTIEECSELWSKLKEKGEQAKAYGKPYGADFVQSVIAVLEKIGVKLSSEDLEKLKGLAGEQLIYVEPQGPERILSVLPQGPGRTGEAEISEGVNLLMKRGPYSNIAHQEEIHRAKVRFGLREDDEE